MHILERGYEETGVNYYITLKNGVTLSWQLDGDTQNGGLPPALYILASTNGKTSWIGESARDWAHEDFAMQLNINSNKFSFFHWYNAQTRDDVKNNSAYGCNKNIPVYKRVNCGQLIYLDNWKISEDYPW